MRVAPLLLLVALTVAPVEAQLSRATRSEDFSRILVVTAHPDDETLVSPLLGGYCGTTSTCKLLVMTHGENGDCVLDDDAACAAEPLGERRAGELAAAAALLHAQLESWTLRDVMENVVENWGGHDAIVARIATAIDDFNPTAIITFDPVHGSTCHPAHRAVGGLVVDAAGNRHVHFIETRARLNDDGTYVLTRAVSNGSRLLFFDLTANWHFIVDDMLIHSSQFDYEALGSIYVTPDKILVLMPAGARAVYDAPCE
jgi:LmbE family N-acetylglucosaminyl deacetylase